MTLRKALVLFLLVLTAFWAGSPAWAGPACPDPVFTQQPDGTKFEALIKGDEYLNWLETPQGYSIIQNSATGYWEYAVPGSNGALAPSGVIVRPDQAPPTNLSPSIRPTASELERPQESFRGTWGPKPVSGAKNIIVILVSFKDRAMSTTAANWNNSIYSATTGVKSVLNFYKDNSFNTMSVNPISHTQSGSPTGIISVTLNRNHPNYGGNYTWSTEQPWLQEAMTLAGAVVNFDAYDLDNTGYITREELVVYLIVAGYERSGSLQQPNIWAHAWSGLSGASPALTAGTKKLDVVALNGELNDNSVQHPIGVVVHELGHQMCGLPDLYDTASSNANGAMGYFSVMASGSWARDNNEDAGTTPSNLDIWCREFLGWTTPVYATNANGLITLGPAISTNQSAVKLLDPSKTSTEYFLVENRYPTGWDAGLRRISSTFQGGLLITHVDIADTPGSNDFNRSGVRAHQGCVPEQASTVFCDMIGSTCRGDQTTLFYAGNNANFGPSTSPNSNYYTLGASNFAVTNISAIGQNMTANFYAPVADPTAPTIKAVNPANGTTNVPTNAIITAAFTKNMDTSTINTTNFTVNGVTGTVTYDTATQVASFRPSSNLAASTAYTATVKGGASGVKDTSGNPLASDSTWTFMTGTGSDVNVPTVVSTSPTTGATNVAANATVTVAFNENLNSSTVNTSTFTVSGAVGTVTFSATTFTATFTPTSSLSASTTYTVTIKGGSSGVKDLAGNALASDYTFTFTTGGRPSVSSTSPANGDTNVSVNANIYVEFNVAMDSTTITTSNITANGGSAANPSNSSGQTVTFTPSGSLAASVNGTVTYNATTQTAIFTPSSSLASGTTYTVTVKGGSSGVKSQAAFAMLADYVFTFTTSSSGGGGGGGGGGDGGGGGGGCFVGTVSE